MQETHFRLILFNTHRTTLLLYTCNVQFALIGIKISFLFLNSVKSIGNLYFPSVPYNILLSVLIELYPRKRIMNAKFGRRVLHASKISHVVGGDLFVCFGAYIPRCPRISNVCEDFKIGLSDIVCTCKICFGREIQNTGYVKSNEPVSRSVL